MTSRVPLVSLERARELGEAMGMPRGARRARRFACWLIILVWLRSRIAN